MKPDQSDLAPGNKVLFIAGYGRSGSTVLATVLADHPAIHSAGELGFVIDDWLSAGRKCSCGQEYEACDFWRDLAESDVTPWEGAALITRKVERRRSFLSVALGVSTRRSEAYRKIHGHILSHIRYRSGKSIIVDSSKTAGMTAARPLALARSCGEDVRVIHLVRDGREILRALMSSGSNWQIEGKKSSYGPSLLRVVLGWLLANTSALLYRVLLGGSKYTLVRYEDFLRDPEGCLERIGHLVGLDMSQVASRVREGASFSVGHVSGGNRVRFSTTIQIRATDKETVVVPLRFQERILFCVLAGWLNRALGYEAWLTKV